MTHSTAARQSVNLPLITAILVGSGLLLRVWQISGARQSLLLIIALLLGLTLYSAAFSFAGTYRAFLVKRQTQGVQAHLLMLAIASILFAPLLAKGELFGQALNGANAPVALMLVVGAFLFGIGMQLGDGCASGTLYTVGGGNRRMLVTLLGFMAGSVIGTLHLPFWWRQPSWGTITVPQLTGSWQSALVLQLLFLLLLSVLLSRIKRHSDAAPAGPNNFRLLGGPWPLWFGALMLAVLNLATLLTAGHPWTIAWGYTLWGGQAAQALGFDLGSTPFWGSGFPANALRNSLLQDATSLMNIGIILGATLAATLARRFVPPHTRDLRQTLSALLGGILMGYGARLAFGCNIGSFFSGVSSFSLHGWLWIAAALPGTWVGIQLRPWFNMRNR